MPRAPRLVLAGQAYHVIQRGNNRRVIFFEDAGRRFFQSALGEALAAHDCQLHAYVLMTNHLHLLIAPRTEAGIGGLMQSLGRRYVAHVNRTHGRTGTLWEGRFKSTIVDAEDYVTACYRYIEANPLRARMVERPEDHLWPSYVRNALGRADPLVAEHECYRALGASGAATKRGWVPGRESFRRQIESALGRRVDPPVRGRPRKDRAGGPEMAAEPAGLL